MCSILIFCCKCLKRTIGIRDIKRHYYHSDNIVSPRLKRQMESVGKGGEEMRSKIREVEEKVERRERYLKV